MKNTFGNNFIVTIYGESHGTEIGCIIDGVAPGIKLDLEFIQKQLNLRKPKGKISTNRIEADDFKIVSGYFNGYTTGTPICISIPNLSQHSGDYDSIKNELRPGHADYTAYQKYLGYQDYRGGGHFSGRITAPLVAAGSIAISILKDKGINIGSHITKLSTIKDREFNNLDQDIELLNNKYFPVLDETIESKMITSIEDAHTNLDSIGGILETIVTHYPAGLGEPFFDSIESTLSHLIFSVPGVKGVEFGIGFEFANLKGSEANDSFLSTNNTITTKTNNNGGINGGISNGMPIIIKTVIKPTPSIYSEQDSVNYATKENIKLKIQGRHDPAIIHRARVVIDSVVAIGLLDLLCSRDATLGMRNKK